MNADPRLSVVVPTYQRAHLLPALLEGLGRQDVTDPFEAIVVVDGSTDGTADLLRRASCAFPLRIVEQPNAGAARARNTGARHARGAVVLFLDDDMEPDPGLVRAHMDAHDGGADAVVGAMPLHPGSPDTILSEDVARWGDELAERCGRSDHRLGPDDIFTGQLSVRRELFERLGGFDERFTVGGGFGNEDVDFAHRLVAGGHRVAFRSDAVSHQRYTVTANEHLRRWGDVGEADMAIARLHADLDPQLRPHRLRSAPASPLARVAVVAPTLVGRLSAPLRWVAAFLVDRGAKDYVTRRLFPRVHLIHYWLGVTRAGGPLDGDRLRVLCWHAVADLGGDPVLRGYGVPPQVLREQLATLRRGGWAVLTVDEYLAFVEDGAPVPRRSVLLTFDDCYESFATAAPAVLAGARAAATSFAVSGRVGDWNRWDEHLGAGRLALADRDALLGLHAAGTEIGAHSRTHPMLTTVDDATLDAEVHGSRTDLAEMGLPDPRLFAYPYGDWDDRVREAVRAAGYRSAFAISPGTVRRTTDPLAAPRVEVYPEDRGRRLLLKVRSGGRLPPPWLAEPGWWRVPARVAKDVAGPWVRSWRAAARRTRTALKARREAGEGQPG